MCNSVAGDKHSAVSTMLLSPDHGHNMYSEKKE